MDMLDLQCIMLRTAMVDKGRKVIVNNAIAFICVPSRLVSIAIFVLARAIRVLT